MFNSSRRSDRPSPSLREHVPQACILVAGVIALAASESGGAGPAPRLVLGSGLMAGTTLAMARLLSDQNRSDRIGVALLIAEALTLISVAATPGTGSIGPVLAALACLPIVAMPSRRAALLGAGFVVAGGLVHAAGGASPAGMTGVGAVLLAALVLGAALVRTADEEASRLAGELRLRNRQLAASNASLMEQNDALDAFNSAVSHDLRSPLTALRLSLECATDEVEPVEVNEAVGDALLATTRMEAMVRELLALSRAGRQCIATAEVSLGDTASQALDQLHAFIEEKDAVVELRGPLPDVQGSGPLLAQVIQNLVENGIKYGNRHGAHVRVLGGRIGNEVFFEVEDNGEGVPEAQQHRIFAPFVQLDQDRDGVGTGLALTRRIVAAHGGRIQVTRSAQLGGATFRVFLPAEGPVEETAPVARGIVLPFPGRASAGQQQTAESAGAHQAQPTFAQSATGTV